MYFFFKKNNINKIFIIYKLPQMQSFSHFRSVLILDNARIHHDQGLLEYLNAFGVRVEFLPPYSSDLNLIESAFSVIKDYLKRNRYFVETCSDPKYPLLIACGQITSELAKGFFRGSGYL